MTWKEFYCSNGRNSWFLGFFIWFLVTFSTGCTPCRTNFGCTPCRTNFGCTPCRTNFDTMSELCQAMALLSKVFDDYAKKDSDKSSLSKGELAELLRNEFPIKDCDQAKVDTFFQVLDGNKDEKVDFQEFATFVVAIAVICKVKTK